MIQLKSFISENLSGFSPRSIPNFLFAFIVCAVLSFVLAKVYVKYGNAVSNRKSFSRNFILLSIATMFIITVVKSSLALSLGLVGALSIVRFRAAIKDPEELIYLFLCIAIGLGCGAGLTILTIIAFTGFVILVLMIKRNNHTFSGQTMYITIAGNGAKSELQNITQTLIKHCTVLKLKRSDENNESFEYSFFIDFENFDKLQQAKEELKAHNPNFILSVFDNSKDY
jgi:Domain of unknown function (DUF4956)